MGRAGPIEADAVGGCQRIHAAESRQVVGDAHAQDRKRGHIPAIGRQLGHLRAGDQGAEFVGFCLDLQGVRLARLLSVLALPTVRAMSSFRV